MKFSQKILLILSFFLLLNQSSFAAGDISPDRQNVKNLREKRKSKLTKLFQKSERPNLYTDKLVNSLTSISGELSYDRYTYGMANTSKVDRYDFSCHNDNIQVFNMYVTGDSAFTFVGAELGKNICPPYVDIKFEPEKAGEYVGNFCVTARMINDDGPSPIQTNCMKVTGVGLSDPFSPLLKTCIDGSVIRIDEKNVSENIPVQGTNLDLVYSSHYTENFKTSFNNPVRVSSFNPEGVSVSINHHYNVNEKRIYMGTGNVYQKEFYNNGLGEVYVVEGNDVHVFLASTGRHLRTMSTLTGYLKYSFEYNSDEKLSKIIDGYGKEIVFTRDGNGRLSTITSSYGEVTTVGLNSSGIVERVTDPAGRSHQIVYNQADGFIHQFIKPNNGVTTFEFSQVGWILSEEKSGGNSWGFDYYYDAAKPGSLYSDRFSKLERYYSTATRVIPETNRYESINYSAGGFENITTEGTDASVSSSNIYESINNTTIADERFGALMPRTNRTTKTIGSLVKTVETTSTIIGGNGFGDFFNYNQINNSTKINGVEYSHAFDKNTLTHTFTNPLGVVDQTVIDSFEKPVLITHGQDTPIAISYDSHGRITQSNQGTANTTQYTYNSKGRLASITNALNQQTNFQYNTAGELVRINYPDGRVLRKQYNSVGQVTKIIPPNGLQHIFTFNAMDLFATYRPPLLEDGVNSQTRYNYNLDQQLTLIIRPDGKRVRFNYEEEIGQLMSMVFSATERQTYAYYPLTEKVRVINSPDQVRSSFTYFGMNQLDSEIQMIDELNPSKVNFSFDNFFRPTQRIVHLDGNEVSRTTTAYRLDSQPLRVGDLRFTYETVSGRPSVTILENVRDRKTYDSFGNLATYRATYNNPSDGAVTELYYFSLTRDVLHRITKKIERVSGTPTTYEYSYDKVGRLSTVTKNGVLTSSNTYDFNSNRVSGTQNGVLFNGTYDSQDRLKSFETSGEPVSNYSYNLNGELIGKERDGIVTNFSSDALGRLKSVTLPDSAQVTYKLDWNGRRVAKLVNGTQVERNIFEDKYKIAVSNENGTIKEYNYGTNINSPDYVRIAGVNYRIFKDHLGSPRVVVNAADGSVVQRMDYNEWGKIIADSNPGFQPFGFAGGIYDRSTKLVKFGARDYDPETGRWLSKDPIRFNGGDANLYGYVLQDPVNLIDPDGNFPFLAIGLIWIGIELHDNGLENPINNMEEMRKMSDPNKGDEILERKKELKKRRKIEYSPCGKA